MRWFIITYYYFLLKTWLKLVEYNIFRHTQMILQHSTKKDVIGEGCPSFFFVFSGTNIDGGCLKNPRRWFCVPSLKLEMLGDPGERRDLDGQGMSTVSEMFVGSCNHGQLGNPANGSMKIIKQHEDFGHV